MKLKLNISGSFHLCLAVCVAIVCPLPGTAYACEGADLEQTNTLYEHFQFANTACNESGSIQDGMNCMAEEWRYNVAKINALPQDCRDMLSEFAPAEGTD